MKPILDFIRVMELAEPLAGSRCAGWLTLPKTISLLNLLQQADGF